MVGGGVLPLSSPKTFLHRKDELFFALVWLVAALISQLRNWLKNFCTGFALVIRLYGFNKTFYACQHQIVVKLTYKYSAHY